MAYSGYLPEDVPGFFVDKNVRDVPGIGKKSATQLAEWGLTTVDEVYQAGELSIERMMGERFASWIIRVYEGKTSSEISPLKSRKSISKEHTFSSDQSNIENVMQKLDSLCELVIDKSELNENLWKRFRS